MTPEKAEKIIIDILALLLIPVEAVTYSHNDKRGHVFSIKSADFACLAKEQENLTRDFTQLLKRIFNQGAFGGEEVFKCTIDINDEQSKVDELIKEKALKAAGEARGLKTDVLMEPMSSYERMIVHSTLTDCLDVSTESVGEGRERRIKVKYLPI